VGRGTSGISSAERADRSFWKDPPTAPATIDTKTKAVTTAEAARVITRHLDELKAPVVRYAIRLVQMVPYQAGSMKKRPCRDDSRYLCPASTGGIASADARSANGMSDHGDRSKAGKRFHP
jgi:hypothetical protein